jgi:2-oxoisovalerate dehydrogenase E1 component
MAPMAKSANCEKHKMNKTKLKCDFNWTQWQSKPADLKSFDPHTALRILFDLFLINEFEHALLRLRNDDCIWGPVHSSVGQEAIAAASIAALQSSDKALGTHRSHHQFLSKVMQYILPDTWNPLRDEWPQNAQEALYRSLAEIMGLAPGYCGGRGGSMHLRHADAGFLGSNAIVGGGLPLAAGAAFAEKYNNTGNIVICFLGDGAVNIGSFHEACNLAGLWKLPVIFFIENNAYAVATHVSQACAVQDISIRASAYDMDGHIVDGGDPVAIHQAVKQAAESIRGGAKPCIIEARCYRRYHHAGDQVGSAFGYRNKEEEKLSNERDATNTFPVALQQAGIVSESDIARIRELAQRQVDISVDACTLDGTPRKVRSNLWPSPASTSEGLRSDGHEWEGVEYTSIEKHSDFKEMKYSDVIATVTDHWLKKDSNVVVMGEEVANLGGGAYGASKGLSIKYPNRVLNTPISEAGFVGLAIGAAMQGMRTVVEIMFPDFSLVAADQLFNQVEKARHMYGNTTDLPLVARTRVAIGCGYGGQHSLDPAGLYALFPGWRIVAPGNGFDYIGLFNSAMRSLDPVLIIEHHSLYNRKYPIPENDFDFYIPFGSARVVAQGNDATLIAYGAMTQRCERLIEQFKKEGISVEVIDLRSIDAPSIDYDTIGDSITKTNAALIVEEAPASKSLGASIAANLTERFFDYLDSPIARLHSLDVPNPVSRVLEAEAIISDQEILQTTIAVARRRWR